MARLTSNTVVRDQRGEAVALLAGQELPEWAVEQVSDYLLDSSPADPPSTSEDGSAAGTGSNTPPVPAAPVEPPRAGRGSGLDAWVAYAQALELEIPDGASRDDLIELVDQRDADES